MTYQIDENKIMIAGKTVVLPQPIFDSVETPLGILVCIDTKNDPNGQNVYLVNSDGQIVWQIERMFPKDTVPICLGFMKVFYHPDLEVYCAAQFDGYTCTLNLNTGRIKDRIFTK